MRRHRTLLVHVAEMSVMDKAMPPPRVGAVTEFPLCFSEIRSSPSDAPKRDVVTVRGVLDLDARGPSHVADSTASEGRWWWTGVLRGDGWSATWHGERPRTGYVEVSGQFSSVCIWTPDACADGSPEFN